MAHFSNLLQALFEDPERPTNHEEEQKVTSATTVIHFTLLSGHRSKGSVYV